MNKINNKKVRIILTKSRRGYSILLKPLVNKSSVKIQINNFMLDKISEDIKDMSDTVDVMREELKKNSEELDKMLYYLKK